MSILGARGFGTVAIAPLLVMGIMMACTSPHAPGEVENASRGNDGPGAPASCESSIVSVVAHQDDDLLFVNPVLLDAIDSGACVQTIYLSAGYAGGGGWEKREAGARAAHALMAGAPDEWSEIVSSTAHAHLFRLVANAKISVVFVRLPCANVRSAGPEGMPTLRQVWESSAAGPTVDGADVLDKGALLATVGALLEAARPTEIHTLNPNVEPYAEHPDHIYAARIARDAAQRVTPNVSVFYHETYPVAARRANVPPRLLVRKRDVMVRDFEVDDNEPSVSLYDPENWNSRWLSRNYFSVAPASAPDLGEPPTWKLFNLLTGACARAEPPASVSTGPCAERGEQDFQLFPDSTLRSSSAGLCLESVGAGITLAACDSSSPGQRWKTADFGRIMLETPTGDYDSAGTCLSVADGYAASSLVTKPCDGSTEERWSFADSNAFNDPRLEAHLAADFDGDTRADVLVAVRDSSSSRILFQVFRSKETGFMDRTTWSSPEAFDADLARLAVGDVDGDKKADLVVAHAHRTDDGFDVSVLHSLGDSFDAPVGVQSVSSIKYDLMQLQMGDFDGDRLEDVAILERGSDERTTISVLRGDGRGFGPPELWFTAQGAASPSRVLSGDTTGDGKCDLVALAESADMTELWTLTSTGMGFAAAPRTHLDDFGEARARWAVGDVDGDGRADAVAVHGNAEDAGFTALLFSAQASGFASPHVWARPDGFYLLATAPALGDVNGDGKMDLVLAHRRGDGGNPYLWSEGATNLWVLDSAARAPKLWAEVPDLEFDRFHWYGAF